MDLLSESKKRRIALIKKLLSEGYSFSKIDKNKEYKKEGWGDSLVFVRENIKHFENMTFRRK